MEGKSPDIDQIVPSMDASAPLGELPPLCSSSKVFGDQTLENRTQVGVNQGWT